MKALSRLGLLLTVSSACAIHLSACTGHATHAEQAATEQSQTTAAITLSGVLTLRGSQMEAWWGMRAQDGKLWRLQAATDAIKAQMIRANNQSVRVEGIKKGSADQGDFPVLLVTKVL